MSTRLYPLCSNEAPKAFHANRHSNGVALFNLRR